MSFDIETIKRKMLVKYPFFGSVVANVDYRANTNIPTAGTDGKVVHYNPEFLEKLSIDEQTFTFAHAICHIAFNHILRSEGKDPVIWNTATDAVINAFLKRDGLKLIEGVVDMADAINYDAEQLYEKLLQEKHQQQQSQENQSQQQNGQQGQQGQSQQNQSGQGDSGQQNQQEKSQDSQSQPQNNQGQSQSSENQSGQKEASGNGSSTGSNSEEQEKQQSGSQSGGGSSSDSESQEKKNDSSSGSGDSSSQDEKQDVGHDTHSMWEDAIKKHKEEQARKDKKESLLDKIFNKDKQEKSQQQSEIEKKQEEIEQLGEKEAFKKNLEEKKKELEELKKALSQQAMGPGSSTNRDIRNITDIGRAKPLIDWRYVLREAIKYDVDWSYKNATIEDGVISANLEEQPMPETEIVLDTSGSINETLLKNFLRECKNILQHSRLKVGCFDTEFYGFHEIRTEEDIENMRFEGGGGTNFDVAVGAFSRRVENKIIFTDGDAYMPDMPLDAIWIVFGGIQINPKGGKVIQIDDEQLDRLYSYQQDSSYKGRSR